MHWQFLFEILVLLAAAVILGTIAERLKQSAIIGYLIAGALVATWIDRSELVVGLAELGVALLLFSIGLEFGWKRLSRMGSAVLVGGVLQIGLTLGATAALLIGLDFSNNEAIAIGAVIALSSTAVVLRTMTGRGEIDSVHGRASLGILLLQDIAVVPLVLLVDSLHRSEGFGAIATVLVKDIFWGAVLVVVLLALVKYLLPYALRSRTLHRNRELPILMAVVAVLGSAWAAHELGLSPALGAFVAGMVLGESPLATQIRADVGALKTLFITLFFSSIGMLADVAWIGQHLGQVLGAVAAVIVGKTLIVWLVGRRLRMAHRHAIAAGLCIAQVGEFSFVIASEARGLISEELFKLLLSVTLVTLLVTPYLIAFAPRVGSGIERWLRRRGWVRVPVESVETMGETSLSGHVIVIGFGPPGRAVVDALLGESRQAVVIDLNARTVMAARSHGLRAFVGDASNPEILEHASVSGALEVVVTLPDHRAAVHVIHQVRAMSPQTRIIARARYNAYADQLKEAGAHTVVADETSVGRRLVMAVNKEL